jgi:hypothetical protein
MSCLINELGSERLILLDRLTITGKHRFARDLGAGVGGRNDVTNFKFIFTLHEIKND